MLVDDWRQHHEQLDNTLADPTLEMPRCFHDHPVTRSAAGSGQPVRPISVYLDGVQFTREDSVLGFWVVCHLTNKRFLSALVRKSELCQCGCRGWCSLHPIFTMLAWSFRALACGVFPSEDPARQELDPIRANFSGERMQFRAAVLFIKGDWMEYCSTLGFPSWNSEANPCFLCHADRNTAYELRGLSALTLPWATKTAHDYSAACAACEITVPLEADSWRIVRAQLKYTYSKTRKLRGRVMQSGFSKLGLQKTTGSSPARMCQILALALMQHVLQQQLSGGGRM